MPSQDAPNVKDLRFIKNGQQLEDRLLELLSQRIGRSLEQLDPETPIQSYGVDSLLLVEISSELEEAFELSLPPTFLWNHPTIRGISKYLIEARRRALL